MNYVSHEKGICYCEASHQYLCTKCAFGQPTEFRHPALTARRLGERITLVVNGIKQMKNVDEMPQEIDGILKGLQIKKANTEQVLVH